MSTGNVTLTAAITGGPTGSRTFGPISTTLASAVDGTVVQSLTTGANTITVPTGATFAIITGPNAVYPKPNPTSAAVLTIKGVSGDTGIGVSSQYPTSLAWDTAQAPATFVINASTSCTVEIFFA